MTCNINMSNQRRMPSHIIWHQCVSEQIWKKLFKRIQGEFHKKISRHQKKKTKRNQHLKLNEKETKEEFVDVFFMFLCFAISQIFQEFWQVVLIKMSNNNFLFLSLSHSVFIWNSIHCCFCPNTQSCERNKTKLLKEFLKVKKTRIW